MDKPYLVVRGLNELTAYGPFAAESDLINFTRGFAFSSHRSQILGRSEKPRGVTTVNPNDLPPWDIGQIAGVPEGVVKTS